MQIYRNDCTEPHDNLRLEERIFNMYSGDDDFFMLWRNDKSVIVGNNQIMENEVDMVFAKEHGVPVIRRITGGGAVYHDLGNINYTYIGKKANEFGNFMIFAQPVIEFLRSLEVDARHIGNNDIGIGDRKISGNAQCVRGENILHHGTLMFDVDLAMLERILTPDPAKLRGKGIESVRSRVCNISETLHMERAAFWEAICRHFKADREIIKYFQ